MGVEDKTAKRLKGTFVGNENILLLIWGTGYTGISLLKQRTTHKINALYYKVQSKFLKSSKLTCVINI